ncbi:MAG: hypothetical protein KDD53_06900, partial [Bdellovibrionales bacterium]|nr:hypothetical protein [Bdellovibrionales bacterium]
MRSKPLTFGQMVSLPARAALKGHISFLLYVGGFILLSLSICRVMHDAALPITEFIPKKNFGIYRWGPGLISALIWIIPLPLVIAAAILPIKEAWARGHLTLWNLVKGTIPALQQSWNSISLSFFAIVYALVPIAVLIWFSYTFSSLLELPLVQFGGAILALVLIVTLIRRLLIVVASIVVTISTNLEAHVALALAHQLMQGRLFQGVSMVAIAVALGLAANWAQPYVDVPLVTPWFVAVLAWYTLGMLTTL